MPVQINWLNTSAGLDEQHVYRSEGSPVDQANLPTPLATVVADAVTYTDTTAVQGKFYYYAVGSVKNGDVALSQQIPIAYIVDTGPGPANIVRGTWEYGYFGSFPAADLITAADFTTLVGSGTANTAHATWFKLAWKGRVVFIPNHNLVTGLTFQYLYQNGWTHGIETVQPELSARLGAIAQDKQITVGARNFRVRLPTSRANHLNSADTTFTGGEVDSLYAAVRFYTNKLAPGLMALGFDEAADLQYQGYYMTLDCYTTAANTIVLRGAGSNNVPSRLQVDDLYNSAYAMTSAQNFRPMLELVT